MKVNLLNRHRMDCGFGFAKQLKREACALLYCFSERSRTNDAENRRECAMLSMRMSLMCMLGVRVFLVGMGVRLVLVIFVRVACIMLRVHRVCGSHLRRQHIHFGRRQAATAHFAHLQPRTHISAAVVSSGAEKGTPASTSAPSSMSPLMPEKHSRYPIRIEGDSKPVSLCAASCQNFGGQDHIH